MSTPGASSLWSGSSTLSGLDSSWGNPFSSGANNMNLLGYGGNSLSNNQGHMQSGASTLGDLTNSNPMGSRGSWGAPGTVPPSQSTNKPASSSGNMQGTLPVSGAQPNGPQSSQPGGSFTTSQSPGPNTASSQGNSAFGNVGFQKISTSNASSGLAINPATSIMNSASNGSSAQSSDNLGSAGWGMPVSTQDSRLTGTSSWGNPSGAEWDQSSNASTSQTQPQIPPSSGSLLQNTSPGIPASAQEQQRPSSWAQAAGKGLNLQTNNQNPQNNVSQEDVQRQALIRRAIESHDGWGKKPIRQDTQWSIETSPKVQRKISTASVVPEQQKGTNNMWNNNNGTAIWEANKENMWGGGNPSAVGRAPGPPPSNWPGAQQKPPDPAVGSQWGVGGPVQAPGPDKGMGPWGAPGSQSNNNNNNWGGSTETGSWGGNFGSSTPGASGGIATWGEADGSSSWGGEGRNSGSGGGVGSGNGNNGDGTSYWGDPSVKPPTQQPNWNAPGGNAGQQAIGQNRKMGSGWGDPIGPPDPKIDDGTGLWASNNQPQRQNSQWGGDAGNPQWNPGAIGKPNPKLANQNPAQFGGVDDLNWNLPKDGAIKFPGTGSQPPQMRSRLIQQLMDLGFKKDEAQHALISNNMNIQSTIADLYNRRGATCKKDELVLERIHSLITDSGASDDISDTQSDSNSFVPNMNPMQNTPYTNAQSKYPFSPGPSLNQSSLGSSNPSINNALQQKIIQKFQSHQQPPPPSMNSINPAQGPMGRGQLPAGQQNPAVQQQMAQQQILQQLRMAVQAGLISPQLLNQQLPGPVLVMLQQLLQQQQNLQQLITTQQMLQQPKMNANPLSQRQQLEQVAVRINQIKQQILLLHRNIAQAQSSLLNKSQSQPPPQPIGTDATEPPLQQEMNNLSISTSQPKSRLNQWKCPTPDKESPEASPATSNETPTSSTATTNNVSTESGESSKTVGSKAIQQSSSTPNLRRYDELGLGGDSTWAPNSSASSQNWPNTSSASSSGSLSENAESKESLAATASMSSGNSSVLDSIPAIPEFVPGKPWQGITKNVEDDPHITPGSFSRSLSVNTIKDDYLSTFTKSSPTSESNSLWPQKPLSSSSTQNKHWSAGESNLTPTSFTSDVWSISSKGAMSRPPPGIPQNKGGWQGSNNGSNWSGSGVSTALLLKNLTPQIDGSTLRTLCMQHGPLQYFYLNLSHFQALVKYCSTEEAVKAQKALNTCLLSNTTIVAEFVSEAEAIRFVEQQNAMPSAPSQWSQMGQPRQSSAIGNPRQDMSMSTWGVTPPTSSGSGMWGNSGSGGSLWGDNLEDNSAHNLLGNMLGDTM
ncbi:Trinucleotide repeat-containing protein 6A protein [Mactra antiquata]